jgi:hypothetical protein
MPQIESVEKNTCRNCGLVFVPSIEFDFYPDGDDQKIGLCENCLLKIILYGDQIPIPIGHEKNMCLIGSGSTTCSFVGFAENKWNCLKGSSLESTIREKIRDGSITAKGDNCSGPPDFKKNT